MWDKHYSFDHLLFPCSRPTSLHFAEATMTSAPFLPYRSSSHISFMPPLLIYSPSKTNLSHFLPFLVLSFFFSLILSSLHSPFFVFTLVVIFIIVRSSKIVRTHWRHWTWHWRALIKEGWHNIDGGWEDYRGVLSLDWDFRIVCAGAKIEHGFWRVGGTI